MFECLLDAAQYCVFKHELTALIDPEVDSLRFYNLGDRYGTRIEHIGAKDTYDPESPLLI